MMNYHSYCLFILLLMTPVMVMKLNAQGVDIFSKSSSAMVSANIVITCEANETNRLDFGKVVREVSQGRIEVSPNGTRIVEGDLSVVNYDFSPAKYSFSGGKGSFSKVVLPNTSVILTNTDRTKTMIVSDWKTEIKKTTKGKDSVIKEVCLGATLNVKDVQESPADYYSGTYEITFLYD